MRVVHLRHYKMEDEPLWEPPSEIVERANITSYMRWLQMEKGLYFKDYNQLWEWSVGRIEDFWESIWQYFRVKASRPYVKVLESRAMPGAKWFDGAELNYAEHIFRERDPTGLAIVSKVESGETSRLSWDELEKQVGAIADSLIRLGIVKGDRIAAYLPNVPEAVAAFLACASLGAIWSSCSPDFGGVSVIDRFRQIEPKVLIAVEGYRYKGRWHDRRHIVEEVRAAIPSIKQVIIVQKQQRGATADGWLDWVDLVSSRSTLRYNQVEFNHPLWILYSSGTTGLPKPIVHGQGGILLEHYKALGLHNNITAKDRMFWYTSIGWMMWNYLVSALLLGSTIILYDGDPFYPNANALWDMAEKNEITFFGTSAAYLSTCMKSGINPSSSNDLSTLFGVGSTGSPLSSDAFTWVYRRVKEKIWLASISGGTDLCTAFVGGCPILPVYAGKIQCRYLGAKVLAYNEQGKSVLSEMGELVLAEPMPSMPLYLWGDASGERYRESYFSIFPAVWRHGDWIMIDENGSCTIFGRSDATIKRMGIRMGTSEIYNIVESIPKIVDSLVVDTEYLGGRSYMVLFVALREGVKLDERLKEAIKQRIRTDLSPRVTPDEIIQVTEVPRTLSGKKLEVPVRRILLGEDPRGTFNPGSLKNPDSMIFFVELAQKIRK